jgi:hypothetical protein
MRKFKSTYILLIIPIFIIQSCVSKPPENPDNISLQIKQILSGFSGGLETQD